VEILIDARVSDRVIIGGRRFFRVVDHLNETSSVELARIATKRAHNASISFMPIMSCREFAAATNDTAA
jgi:hypothetical protein